MEQPPKKFIDMGMMQGILEDLAKKNDAFYEKLKHLPKESHVLPPAELEEIVQVGKFLKKFLFNYRQELENTRDAEKQEYTKKKFQELQTALDSSKVFVAKFATENSGGASDKIPLQDYSPIEDSLYYVTRGGASLRLKTARLPDGLDKVVQPISEIIVFEKENELNKDPEIGSRVVEYFSNSLSEAAEKESTALYHPELSIYFEDEKIFAVAKFDAEKGKFLKMSIHEGDRINKIFFKRQ